jgi:hypothetical protein
VNRIVHAEGRGSIAVGGDAINSIFVTGGVNQFFVGQYERLADAYVNSRSLYRELHLDEFTGRAWLLRGIDEFVATNDHGYVVIEAEAGMGKTAFMAWLARERRYVHHFVRLMPDTNDVGAALRSLSAQLIRAWDLQTFAVGGVLPPNASRPDFFEDVLHEAAEKRDATRPGEAIVIAIDGLNETTAPAGQNPLALPANLPRGVYMVVSQRTTHVPLVVTTPRRVIRISPGSPENLADIRLYLEAATAEPGLERQLATVGITAAELVERLVRWSNGVWLVLRYVLAELRTGVRTADNLEALPVGLWQYYARFWVEWQRTHEGHWGDTDFPLLVTLTAVQEPVPLPLLCELSGCGDPERAALLVGDAWRPFLHVQEEPEERYAVFHESLVEFVAGKVDVDTLTAGERSFVRRLADAHRAAHQRIADRYLTAWGGVSGGLPGLRAEAAAVMDGGYGLRHLVHHLVHASADVLVHLLMELEWPRDDVVDAVDSSSAANAWYEAHRVRRAFASYALDVERAWSYAEHSAIGPTAERGMALEFRYALMSASVNSVTGNVSGDLLLLLVDSGLATPAEALDVAREAPDPRTRAEALTTLLPRLSGELRDEAQRDALASANAVPDGYWRAGELVRLISVVDTEHLAAIERLANAMSERYYRTIVGQAVAARRGEHTHIDALTDVPSSSLNPANPDVFATQYRERTEHAVATLVAGSRRGSVADTSSPSEHVAASRFIRDPRWRAQMLVASARAASREVRDELLKAALAISLSVGDREAFASTVGSIAACVAGVGEVSHALACAAELGDPEDRARALFRIAEAVPADERSDVVAAALRSAGEIDEPAVRSQVLREHAAKLGPPAPGDQLERLIATLTSDWRADVLAALAPQAPPTRRADELAAAVAASASGSDDAGRARVLTALLPELPLGLLPEARESLREIRDPEARDCAAAAFAARFAALSQGAVADDVMSTIRDQHWLAQAELGTAVGLAACGRSAEAARVAARIGPPPWRAEALALAGDLGESLALADGTSNPDIRTAVLLRIAHVVALTGQSLPNARDPVDEARTALLDVAEPALRARLVVPVAVALASSGRSDAALDLVRGLGDDEARTAAMLSLVEHLQPNALTAAIAVVREISDPVGRARVLAGLTPLVVMDRLPVLQAHVREVLHLLGTSTRAQFLDAFPDLLPGLTVLAGYEGLLDIAGAVLAVYRWWP